MGILQKFKHLQIERSTFASHGTYAMNYFASLALLMRRRRRTQRYQNSWSASGTSSRSESDHLESFLNNASMAPALIIKSPKRTAPITGTFSASRGNPPSEVSCLVPRPHFSSRPKRSGSRGPCENVGLFPPVRLGYVTKTNWPSGTGKTPYRD